MSDSCINDFLINNDGNNRNTSSSNRVREVLNNHKLSSIKRTIDTKSTGTFIFHKEATSSRIHFGNDKHKEYVDAATLKRLKVICKRSNTVVTRISSDCLLSRKVKSKKESFGKIRGKNATTKSYSSETTKTVKKIITNELPKILGASDISDDTDIDSDSDSVIYLGTFDAASSKTVTSSKNCGQSSSLVLNNSESDITFVKKYCLRCEKDLSYQINDKHTCPYFVHQKRTELTNNYLEKIRNNYGDDITNTSPGHGNNYNHYLCQNAIVNEEQNRRRYYQLMACENNDYHGLNSGFEHNHDVYLSTELSLYVNDRFEKDCNDNTSGNYIAGYNYFGSSVRKKSGLRLIVIDGSNVALGHSKGKFFSSEGLKICINYFCQRGHEVKAFVPQFRLKNGQTSNKELLQWLYDRGWVIFTPSREVNGRMIVPYDDRFIVQCAVLGLSLTRLLKSDAIRTQIGNQSRASCRQCISMEVRSRRHYRVIGLRCVGY